MTTPTSFILPTSSSTHPSTSDLSPHAFPLLINSQTTCELITFAITFAQYVPSDGRLVIISGKPRNELLSSMSASLFTACSSSFTSTSAILAADKITLYHVETLAMLRVLLSSLQHSKVSFLGVDGFVSLQEEGAELSAQGISRTLAAMVNITSYSKGILVIRESPANVERGVPVLNTGIHGTLGHSSVKILQILGRWMRGFWKQEEKIGGECSATWICRGENSHIQWTSRDGEIDDVHISIL